MINKIKSPIIPRNKKDPTQSFKSLNKTYRNIENRYHKIKLRFNELLSLYLKGVERESNQSFIFSQGTIYQANSNYIYDLSASELDALHKLIQDILDEYLLEGGRESFWRLSTIEDEYNRGTHSAYINLSYQSAYYAEETTLMALLAKPAYQNQIKQAFTLSFNGWKSLTETAKSDLSHVLASAIARGINPRETAKIISKRLEVSMSKAKSLAQTEQLAAYRQAQWNETTWTQERLGLNTALLHISAKLPTSRVTHVYWDGRIRTVEDVQNWYEENGNRYNCHCAQLPILLNENGEPYNKFVIEQLTKEREKWLNE